MAAIDLSSISAPLNDGILQLQNGVAMSSTLTSVTDQSNTASTLKLSTTSAQFTSPLRITTDDPSDFYLDCEDGSANNRFSITRNTASQQVNLNFASNPAGSTTTVGAIRTYVDGVNLTEVMKFREDGQLQIGSTSASAMYWDNVNNRLGIGTNAPTQALDVVGQSRFSDNILFTTDYKYIGRELNASSIRFSSLGSEVMVNISTAGRFAVNFPGSVRFQVSAGGQTTISGGGSTSATTSLLVQNSSGTAALTVNDGGNVVVGSDTNDEGYKFKVTGNSRFTGNQLTITNDVLVGTTFLFAASACFKIDSTTKGFLPPRMTDAQIRAIATPAEGLIAYNTTISHLCCYQAGAWVKFSHSPM